MNWTWVLLGMIFATLGVIEIIMRRGLDRILGLLADIIALLEDIKEKLPSS